MDNIIKELIQIESEADSRITDAREKMGRLDEQMRKKETEIRESIDRQTTEQLKKLSDDADKESVQEIAKIKQHTEQTIEDLEKLYEQNRSHWEADIVNQIIGS